jgi:hypothetical protein
MLCSDAVDGDSDDANVVDDEARHPVSVRHFILGIVPPHEERNADACARPVLTIRDRDLDMSNHLRRRPEESIVAPCKREEWPLGTNESHWSGHYRARWGPYTPNSAFDKHLACDRPARESASARSICKKLPRFALVEFVRHDTRNRRSPGSAEILLRRGDYARIVSARRTRHRA